MKARDLFEYGRKKMRRDSSFSPMEIANLAGRHLTTMRRWAFMEKRAAFGLVSGQDYAALPTDCEQVFEVDGDDSGSCIELTTPDVLLRLRREDNATVLTDQYYSVAGYRDLGTDQPSPVLELDHAPGATNASWGQVWYLASWQEITSEEDLIEMPRWIEPLYYALYDQWLFGSEEHDVAPLLNRLEDVRRSSLYTDAMTRDEDLQTDHGVIEGGAALQGYWRDSTTDGRFSTSDP